MASDVLEDDVDKDSHKRLVVKSRHWLVLDDSFDLTATDNEAVGFLDMFFDNCSLMRVLGLDINELWTDRLPYLTQNLLQERLISLHTAVVRLFR